ncbi:hypothetical protein Sjap_019468 [Stephania japonica]|uniref:Dof zinc finger protein n=1 Tax=Stephania japonica TaxID=461633 RepID=A0AAP0EZH8_9MAGN
MQDPTAFQAMKPHFPEQEHLKCPRCDSNNTKFCYYNNYNLSQPRHFCKNCRRYWTKGGALRNIPVGGGSRKNTKRASNPKRSSSAATPTSNSSSISSSSPVFPKTEETGVFVAARRRRRGICSGRSGPQNAGHDGELQLSVGLKRAVWESVGEFQSE